ncbi:hypothetical protein [Bacillus sp. EB600]|uniref:hypothetical protein n=1 Tax=Bacillus sp. EB600 TaxID=2806345 RepID=UPI00210B8E19|nr:hypothetical protein [Bacillus sp. EB600]MCQ6280810.1 hypothetical protein [Bacillus sp. EB600]
MIREGTFQEDLYYRLNIIPIYIPRVRKEDIIPLIYHFLKGLNYKYGLNRSFTHEALTSLQNHEWPGNVQELQNIVERISLISTNSKIDIQDIQNEMAFSQDRTQSAQSDINTANRASSEKIQPLKSKLEEVEFNLIQETIDLFPSVRKAALIILGFV